MAVPKIITTLRRRGYDVDEAHPGTDDGPATYYVAGHGVALYVSADDAETWDSLADKAAHDERAAQARGDSTPLDDAIAAAEAERRE